MWGRRILNFFALMLITSLHVIMYPKQMGTLLKWIFIWMCIPCYCFLFAVCLCMIIECNTMCGNSKLLVFPFFTFTPASQNALYTIGITLFLSKNSTVLSGKGSSYHIYQNIFSNPLHIFKNQSNMQYALLISSSVLQ